MKNRLKDRNILITNDSSHFTAGLASRLAEYGANVLIADKNTEALRSFTNSFSEQREVYGHFGRVALIDFDKSKNRDLTMIFQKASESFGGINCWLDMDALISNVAMEDSDFVEQNLNYFTNEILPIMGLYKQAMAFLQQKRNASILKLCPQKSYRQPSNEINSFYAAAFEAFHSSINQQKKSELRFMNLEVGPTEVYLKARYPKLSANDALTKLQEFSPEAELVDVEELATSIAFLVGDHRSNLKISNLSLLSQ